MAVTFAGEGPSSGSSSLDPNPPCSSAVDAGNAVLHEAPFFEKIPTSNLDSPHMVPKSDDVGPLSGDAQASTWKGALVGNSKSGCYLR
ncbi:hypothetical protein SUGI_0416520 [Cryptomeria japonica]|nr:hypothetical protein SUGI_0416520 [Cryptomeria japonica]